MGRFSATATSSPNKKLKYKSSEELIQKVWDCVRSNSGIMVLLQLMQIKTPITDADCIRTLACKALAGLARSDTVRQIVSKLPLFTSGQLQSKLIIVINILNCSSGWVKEQLQVSYTLNIL